MEQQQQPNQGYITPEPEQLQPLSQYDEGTSQGNRTIIFLKSESHLVIAKY